MEKVNPDGMLARVWHFATALCLLSLLGCRSVSEPAPGLTSVVAVPEARPLRPAPEPAVARVGVPSDWRFALEPPSTHVPRQLVASESPPASEVGLRVLASGGNAIDAAVATAFALAVVFPEAGNLGGGGFAVLRAADGRLAALDFRETAPAAARRDMFLDADGKPLTLALTDEPAPLTTSAALDVSKVGHRASGVPGSVAGLWALHQRFGSLPWRELVRPAEELAERGFVVGAAFARNLSEAQPRWSHFAASRALFAPTGEPLAAGATLANPDLAAALRRIAENGRDGFYAGKTAALIAAEMRRGGGLVDERDLSGYEAKWRTPIEVDYRSYKLVSMPPPSSGGVALALIANLLGTYSLKDLGWHSVEHLHLLAEALQRAFADRNNLLGDVDFVNVPLAQLLSGAYASERQRGIGQRATPSSEVRAGLPLPEGNHTTHFAVVDRDGAAVSLTTTINDLYGSGVTVTGAGFVLNNEMDDFTIRPGVPNLFGLVQGEANAIVPGKRMLSSMAPTLVLDAAGHVRLATGARGGPRIISATWQVISNIVDFDMSLGAAVSAPRVHHQWYPDELLAEAGGVSASAVSGLTSLGHRVRFVPEIGDAPSIAWDRQSARWDGIADPRHGGAALGE